VDEKINVKNI